MTANRVKRLVSQLGEVMFTKYISRQWAVFDITSCQFYWQ